MTIRRDLKRRIRERQQQTGERYAAARAQVLAQRTAPPWVVELLDLSEAGRARGLVVPVRATASLAPAGARALDALRVLLDSGVAALEPLRRALLLGDCPPLPTAGAGPRALHHLHRFREFLRGAAAGLRGVGPGGLALIFDVDLGDGKRPVMAHALRRYRGGPLLVLSPFSPAPLAADDVVGLWTRWILGEQTW